ncbi:hypothetical protein BKA70DRAFT_2817 [Coprinopsis sp. MPI-PUGE-AT-0042]|nr:hypothetical protein BKA70DRAFT_2817 [Coprinopsis sp. MPI-PUGE-AT-0042]
MGTTTIPSSPTSVSETSVDVSSTGLQIAPEPGMAVATSVPISRIAFPFNSSPPTSRRKPLTSPPASLPQQRRFVPVPSPLGRKEDSPAPPPRRSPVSRIAAYRAYHRNHGYSRQALLHAKWFWSTREGEWQDSAKPVAGLMSPEVSVGLKASKGTKPPAFEGDAFEGDDEERAISPAVTAFPRRGDITALRDPYCVEADRCFAHVPMWTLAKVLWVHDMHALSQPKVETPAPDAEDDPFDEVSSVSSFDTSTSIDFSDDSESTLVDSESEWESGYFKGWESPRSQAASSSSSLVSPPKASPLAWTKDVYLKPPPSSSSSHPPNWYRRWEILLELSKSEKRPEKSPPLVVKPLPKKAVAPPPKRYSFTRGFLTGLKKSPRSPTTANYVVQDSFINASHPAAG